MKKESGKQSKMARVLEGVVRRKNGRTIMIEVKRLKAHSRYLKRFWQTTKYLVDDPKEQAKVGERVKIISVRPLSARKRFRFLSKVTAEVSK